MIVSPTQVDIQSALRAFLLGILPLAPLNVVVGQVNRVSQPKNADFVVMWPILRGRIETNVESFNGLDNTSFLQPTEVTMQLDVHGPSSADNAQIISTMFRSTYGVDTFLLLNENITPLFVDDPRQVPFINAEQQIENRWTVDVHLQVNASIDNPQQSADVAEVDVINVEATYT